MPSPRMPASPREAPSTVHCALVARARACGGRAGRPAPRSSASVRARRRSRASRPARPRHRHGVGRAPGAASTSAAARARAPAQRVAVARRAGSGCQPRRERSQPTSSSAGDAESGWWRTVTPAIACAARARRAAGRRSRRGARATASSAATRGRRRRRARRARRARRSASAGVGLVDGVAAARPGASVAASASTASGWPCGDHTTVARSVTTSGSTIVSRCAQVLLADVDDDRLAQQRELAGLGLGVGAAIVATASIVVAARLDGADDGARRRGSARRRAAGWRSRRCTRVSTTQTRFSARAGT